MPKISLSIAELPRGVQGMIEHNTLANALYIRAFYEWVMECRNIPDNERPRKPFWDDYDVHPAAARRFRHDVLNIVALMAGVAT